MKNIVIIGCGESGSEIASKYSAEGYNVYVFDKNKESFKNLHSYYSGFQIEREINDAQTIISACPRVDILVIVTENDDLNIFLSMIAVDILEIKNVVTRLYDDSKSCLIDKEEITVYYPSKLAVDTVCATLKGLTK